MQSGQIHRQEDFYFSSETGRLEPKYFVVLALNPDDDVVARLLTSRAHGRPERPPCYHGHPYPGFYLDVLGAPLGTKSWVDLRGLEDFDISVIQRKQKQKRITLVTTLPVGTLAALLECAANADDTTKLQEASIRNQLAALR
jgi:hypothetical protein